MSKPHELRIQVINPHGTTPEDQAFITMLAEHPPKTKFQSGDLAMLVEVPRHFHHGTTFGEPGTVPNIWEVRAVYSRYQFELHRFVHQTGGMLDWAHTQIEMSRRLPPNRYRDAVIYAHAFPHGQWPSTAEWFPEWCLKRLMLKAPTPEWQPILDEFSSPYMGYDMRDFGMGVVFDLAPDIYGDQREKVRPLVFEEEAFHRAALVGLEEKCIVPSDIHDLETSAADIFDIWG